MVFLDDVSFCLDSALLGQVGLPGEAVRIAIAFLGLLISSYYDIFNKRNVPDKFLYGFFLLAVLTNIPFFNSCLSIYSLAIALPLLIFGYATYKLGQLGGADVIMMLSLVLLVPIHPSFVAVQPNYPFALSLFLFSFTLFTLYTLVHFGLILLRTRAKPDLKYALLIIPYAIILYMLTQLPIVSAAYIIIMSIAILGSVFYLTYRQPLMQMLSQKLPLSKVEPEDVIVLDMMDQKIVNKYKIQRLASKQELDRLKQLKVSYLWVYTKLPPFLPFMLAGFLLALLFAPVLLS